MPIEINNLSPNETLYLSLFKDDFYGELNCMEGMPERRHPARRQLMGDATFNIQAQAALFEAVVFVDENDEKSPLLCVLPVRAV